MHPSVIDHPAAPKWVSERGGRTEIEEYAVCDIARILHPNTKLPYQVAKDQSPSQSGIRGVEVKDAIRLIPSAPVAKPLLACEHVLHMPRHSREPVCVTFVSTRHDLFSVVVHFAQRAPSQPAEGELEKTTLVDWARPVGFVERSHSTQAKRYALADLFSHHGPRRRIGGKVVRSRPRLAEANGPTKALNHVRYRSKSGPSMPGPCAFLTSQEHRADGARSRQVRDVPLAGEQRFGMPIY